MENTTNKSGHKYIPLYEKLFNDILTGNYVPGDQIPPDTTLARDFNISRPTAAKAIKLLENKGLVFRKPGAGTFVRQPELEIQNKIGLLFPRLAVDPQEYGHFVSLNSIIISEISRRAHDNEHVVLLNNLPFGNEDQIINQSKQICQQLINYRVKGAFFMPFELSPENRHVNIQIAERLRDAGVAVTLIDRDVYSDGKRSEFDVVCVDNQRGTFEITKHLIDLGCSKIDFVTSRVDVTSIAKRIDGYRCALEGYGGYNESSTVHRLPFLPFFEQDIHHVQKAVVDFLQNLTADALVCVNDRIASIIMHHALQMGIRIPEDLRLVGFDDEPFGAYLPVPLTTMRQPAIALGAEAMRMLISRSQEMDMPPREVMLKAELVIRQSCGSKLNT